MIDYKIIHNPDYTNLSKIGIRLVPDSLPLKFFFSSMRMIKYPELINDVCNDIGFFGDPQGVIFYNDLDGEDFAEGNVFKQNEVKVYHHNFGEVVIERLFFKKLLFDYSKSLIEIYANSSQFPNSWIIEMKHSITFLANNIEIDENDIM